MNRRGTLPTLILEALEHEPKHGYLIAKRIREPRAVCAISKRENSILRSTSSRT